MAGIVEQIAINPVESALPEPVESVEVLPDQGPRGDRYFVETPDAASPEGSTLEERAKIRTTALIEFEIDRDPDRPNGEIAKVVRCSVPAVLKARKRMEAEGKTAKKAA